jgi:predicted nucleotidyltransferase
METPSSPQADLSNRAIATRIGAVAADDRRILAVYLFGSRTRDEAHPDSDVDLAVLFEERQSLSEVIGVVDLGKADTFLALDVIRGERIYCADSYRCDLFDLYVLRRAGDQAHLEKERRRVLLDPDRHRTAAEVSA